MSHFQQSSRITSREVFLLANTNQVSRITAVGTPLKFIYIGNLTFADRSTFCRPIRNAVCCFRKSENRTYFQVFQQSLRFIHAFNLLRLNAGGFSRCLLSLATPPSFFVSTSVLTLTLRITKELPSSGGGGLPYEK